jgi:hypothetical protein
MKEQLIATIVKAKRTKGLLACKCCRGRHG